MKELNTIYMSANGAGRAPRSERNVVCLANITGDVKMIGMNNMEYDENIRHFEDKELTCSKCGRIVFIPHNQIGGFWYLSSYVAKDETVHSGGYCSDCFDKLNEKNLK